MGPDFLGNSCSNTLRSSCNQLKWPLMNKKTKTASEIAASIKVHLVTLNVFLSLCLSLCPTPPHSPLLLTASSREKNCRDSLSPWLPYMVSWATEQHLSQALPPSLSCLLISLPPFAPHSLFASPSGQSWGFCSPQAPRVTNLHIIDLALRDWGCKLKAALQDWHWPQ